MIYSELPSTLTRIGDYAFFGTGIAEITLKAHITSIGYYAFNRNTVIRGEDETQHSVTVSDFYMSRYELAQAEYEAVMGENPRRMSE